MRAVQVTGYGGVEKLEVVDVPIPTPNAGEVLIKVKACGINNTEIWMREGAYGAESKSGWKEGGVQFPRIPGSDITGVIVRVGKDVDDHWIGKDVVVFPYTASGPEGLANMAEDLAFIGSEYDGGYAQYVAWPVDLCFDMPLDSYLESAVFSVSGMTAWHMNEQIRPKPGQTIVVTGANGGVGSFNVQIAAKVHGAKVIAIVGDLSLTEQMKTLGATHVLSYQTDRLEEEVLSIAGGPVDAILDVVGDALIHTMIQVLKRGGKFCIAGSIGGQVTEIDLRDVYLKHLTIYGSVLGTRGEFKQMLAAVSEGKLLPIIDRTFPLEEAAAAQTYFKDSGKMGKIVLLPGESDEA